MRQASGGQRGDALRISDILEAAALLDELRRRGRVPFGIDPHAQAPAVRYLEIIGGAAGNLSASFRKEHPDLPIRQMRGLASFAKHEYWRVQEQLLWEALEAIVPIRRTLETLRATG